MEEGVHVWRLGVSEERVVQTHTCAHIWLHFSSPRSSRNRRLKAVSDHLEPWSSSSSEIFLTKFWQ